MTRTTDTLKIDVILEIQKGLKDIKVLTQAVKKNTDKMEKGFKKVNQTVRNFGTLIVGIATGVALRKLGKAFISASDKTEQFRFRMEALLRSQEEANLLFEKSARIAAAIPFEFEEVIESATILSAIVKGGAAEVAKWLPIIADVASVAGFSFLDTTTQIQRMISAGAAAADRFREKGTTAMLGFQVGVQISAEETRKKLIESWLDVESNFRGASERMATTWTGTMSILKDAFFITRAAIGEQGSFEFLKDQLKEIKQAAQDLSKEKDTLKDISDSIVTIGGAIIKVLKFLNFLGKALTFISGTVIGGLEAALRQLAGVVLNLSSALFFLINLKFERAFGFLKGIVTAPINEFKRFTATVEVFFNKLFGSVKETGEVLEETLDDIDRFTPRDAIFVAIDSLRDLKLELEEISDVSGETFPNLIKNMKAFTDNLEADLERVRSNFMSLGNTIASVFESSLTSGRDFLQSLGDEILNFLNRMVARAAAFLLLSTIPGFGAAAGGFGNFVLGGTFGVDLQKLASTSGNNVSQNVTFNVSSSVNKSTRDLFRNEIIPMFISAQKAGRLNIV